jgi:hypothetical protein
MNINIIWSVERVNVKFKYRIGLIGNLLELEGDSNRTRTRDFNLIEQEF